MKKILTIILCSALVMISGCDKYDFDQEQFRKEVNLLSNSNLVYDRQVAELQQGGDTLFVVWIAGYRRTGNSGAATFRYTVEGLQQIQF
jgi:hypothetical protein